MNHPAFLRTSLLGLALTIPTAACQLPKAPPKAADEPAARFESADPDSGLASTKTSATQADDGSLAPARRAGAHADGDSIPQMLARTREQLQVEARRNLELAESLKRAQSRIAELEASVKINVKDVDDLKLEKDKLAVKVRELQERLVSAALRVASAEKETLEVKIAYEKAVALAAEHGVLVERGSGGVKPESAPAPRRPPGTAAGHSPSPHGK